MFLKNRKIIPIAAIFATVLVLTSGGTLLNFFKKPAKTAEAVSLGLPFGGPILSVQYCCVGVLLTINNYNLSLPGPHKFLFVPGFSQLFANYQIVTPGICTLGNSVPGGVCLNPGKKCAPGDAADGGIITMVGTNLLPTMCKL